MFVEVGELDPCAMWVEALPEKDNLRAEVLKGVDHVFKGKTEEFIALPDKTLFN